MEVKDFKKWVILFSNTPANSSTLYQAPSPMEIDYAKQKEQPYICVFNAENGKCGKVKCIDMKDYQIGEAVAAALCMEEEIPKEALKFVQIIN